MRFKRLLFLTPVISLAIALAAHADLQSERIVNRARRVASRIKTLQAERVWIDGDFYITRYGRHKVYSLTRVRLMKPLYAYIKEEGAANSWEFCICDGRRVYWIHEKYKLYEIHHVPQTSSLDIIHDITRVGQRDLERAFFSPQTIAAGRRSRYLGVRKIADSTYHAVQVDLNPTEERDYYFGAEGLLEGVVYRYPTRTEADTITKRFRHVRLNVPMKARQFAWSPPPGFRRHQNRN